MSAFERSHEEGDISNTLVSLSGASEANMTGPLAVFIFLSALCEGAVDQIPVTVFRPGDSVTLTCSGSFNEVNVTKSQSCVQVRQSPSSAAVVPGRSVSLQCSLQPKNNKSQIQCPQQDNVHWFRAGSEEPHTGLMYNSTNYSCVYRLSKTIGHSSDAGTYYCAVDTCGHILFGTGTKVDIGHRADVNYAALNFSSRKVRQSSKPRAEQECVYSSVRADQHT
ncbi:hypothetical protein WMY93_032074 [Mugilogobius chulae]|uniref:Ig-like domain-containing protein n=1 Tax=Mugilogobius chulae TaxID=88201 RepID=A0AAW0MF27_9GOBI